MKTVRIAAAQTLEYRENIEAALTCALDMIRQAEAEGARLLCFPEGFLQGYLTEPEAARRAAMGLASPTFKAVTNRLATAGLMIVMGMIESEGDDLFNTAVVIQKGEVIGRYRKAHLLKGERFFRPGTETPIFTVDGLRFGINICYDTGFPEAAHKVALAGASLLVCCANNMMPRANAEKFRHVHNAARGERCRETGLWLISADVTGERNGRISWGPTAVLNPAGNVVAELPLEAPGLLVFDIAGDQ
ncbi:carbon-nitrogen hydrolase family protein [Rhizobium sp. WYJ-E13]|jgi:predicted amidohydrolase|uniref:carbon-nitrogen hydrolase family protein n=1 Tax=unclassified Rhizobium TaxID=2613769 RepID=UPI001C1F1CC6|nr:carbon-nitrogen hydrolase family protein [Rhizobium sp. WYJ-E13]QWW70283.1 carbon-nitrogen hydrolase family protein [Rhizobium sp. WYJ-E13]